MGDRGAPPPYSVVDPNPTPGRAAGASPRSAAERVESASAAQHDAALAGVITLTNQNTGKLVRIDPATGTVDALGEDGDPDTRLVVEFVEAAVTLRSAVRPERYLRSAIDPDTIRLTLLGLSKINAIPS